jgi:hypothetical protein
MKREDLLQELQSFSVIELLELYIESRTEKYIDIYEYDIEHLPQLEIIINDIIDNEHFKKHTPTKS